LSQDDGSYLVRPYLSRRLVYRTDKATKERFVAFRSGIDLVAVILLMALFLSAFAAFARIPYVTALLDYWLLPALLALLVCLIPSLIAARIWERRLLRTGTRVSAQLWAGHHPFTVMPLWLRVTILVIYASVLIWMSANPMAWRVGIAPVALAFLFGLLIFIRRGQIFSGRMG